jgi:glycosyltransferase involved in cell wall biosynthesis
MDKVYINGKFVSQPITGVQRYASELSNQLFALHAGTTVVAPVSNLLGETYRLTCPVEQTGEKGSIYWEQWQLPAYLRRREQPLLLNLCNMAPLFYRNKITCVHDISFAVNPQYYSRRFYYYYKTIVPRIIRSSRHVITVSRFSQTALMEQYGLTEHQVSVIPNAASGLLKQVAASQTLQPLVEKPYFLFVGSVDPRKNLLFLLESFLQAGLKDMVLVVVGGGYKSFNEEVAERLEAYKNNPSIRFLGAVSNETLAACYRFAKAVIVPSLYEGFGLPIVEALQLGCPVLASDIPVFREVGEDYVQYFDPRNRESLVSLLTETAHSSVNGATMQAAQVFIEQKYSWQHSAKLLYTLLQSFA